MYARKPLLGIAVWLLLASSASAAVPDSISYQGVLNTSEGSPVADGGYSVTFSVYETVTGGTALWTETKSVSTVSGLFSTFLGSVTPLHSSVFSGPNRWLGITVAADPEMTPRQAIVAVPYAYRIATVDGSSGGTIMGDVAVASGNLNLDNSSPTSGVINIGGSRFIHNYGTDNSFIGQDAGNLTMTGNFNTASGRDALNQNTSGVANTANGYGALVANTEGSYNTASGIAALFYNSTGENNTASGHNALNLNTTGFYNTASGTLALAANTAGNFNTALGSGADVTSGALTNATAIGYNAKVNASNKIRLGNTSVTVIEGQVAYTFPSDSTLKENFQPVDGDEVLRKIRDWNLRSWNYKCNDPQQFRHYGPMAQEFFAAFGHDGIGTSGTPTTINSGDEAGILMIAVQALMKKNEALEKHTEEINDLKAQVAELRELIRAQPNQQK